MSPEIKIRHRLLAIEATVTEYLEASIIDPHLAAAGHYAAQLEIIKRSRTPDLFVPYRANVAELAELAGQLADKLPEKEVEAITCALQVKLHLLQASTLYDKVLRHLGESR